MLLGLETGCLIMYNIIVILDILKKEILMLQNIDYVALPEKCEIIMIVK